MGPKIELREINGVRWILSDQHGRAEGPESDRPAPDELPVGSAIYKSTDTKIEYRLFPNRDKWMKRPHEADVAERFV